MAQEQINEQDMKGARKRKATTTKRVEQHNMYLSEEAEWTQRNWNMDSALQTASPSLLGHHAALSAQNTATSPGPSTPGTAEWPWSAAVPQDPQFSPWGSHPPAHPDDPPPGGGAWGGARRNEISPGNDGSSAREYGLLSNEKPAAAELGESPVVPAKVRKASDNRAFASPRTSGTGSRTSSPSLSDRGAPSPQRRPRPAGQRRSDMHASATDGGVLTKALMIPISSPTVPHQYPDHPYSQQTASGSVQPAPRPDYHKNQSVSSSQLGAASPGLPQVRGRGLSDAPVPAAHSREKKWDLGNPKPRPMASSQLRPAHLTCKSSWYHDPLRDMAPFMGASKLSAFGARDTKGGPTVLPAVVLDLSLQGSDSKSPDKARCLDNAHYNTAGSVYDKAQADLPVPLVKRNEMQTGFSDSGRGSQGGTAAESAPSNKQSASSGHYQPPSASSTPTSSRTRPGQSKVPGESSVPSGRSSPLPTHALVSQQSSAALNSPAIPVATYFPSAGLPSQPMPMYPAMYSQHQLAAYFPWLPDYAGLSGLANSPFMASATSAFNPLTPGSSPQLPQQPPAKQKRRRQKKKQSAADQNEVTHSQQIPGSMGSAPQSPHRDPPLKKRSKSRRPSSGQNHQAKQAAQSSAHLALMSQYKDLISSSAPPQHLSGKTPDLSLFHQAVYANHFNHVTTQPQQSPRQAMSPAATVTSEMPSQGVDEKLASDLGIAKMPMESGHEQPQTSVYELKENIPRPLGHDGQPQMGVLQPQKDTHKQLGNIHQTMGHESEPLREVLQPLENGHRSLGNVLNPGTNVRQSRANPHLSEALADQSEAKLNQHQVNHPTNGHQAEANFHQPHTTDFQLPNSSGGLSDVFPPPAAVQLDGVPAPSGPPHHSLTSLARPAADPPDATPAGGASFQPSSWRSQSCSRSTENGDTRSTGNLWEDYYNSVARDLTDGDPDVGRGQRRESDTGEVVDDENIDDEDDDSVMDDCEQSDGEENGED